MLCQTAIFSTEACEFKACFGVPASLLRIPELVGVVWVAFPKFWPTSLQTPVGPGNSSDQSLAARLKHHFKLLVPTTVAAHDINLIWFALPAFCPNLTVSR